MALTQSFWDDLVELDRPFGDFFRPFAFPWWRPRFAFSSELAYMPAADVYARNGDIVVRVELPGIDPEKDVKVTLDDGMLAVKGERKQEKEIKEEGYYRKEASYGAFERRIPLPAGIKESDIKADYKDGVLEIVVTGAAKALPKSISKEIPIHKKEALSVKG
jgi:HSP20 family molecular chaperone IbpA